MADYTGVLADLKARRDALNRERAELETVIGGIERILAAREPHQASSEAAPRRPAKAGSLSGLTMPQVITQLLQNAAEPQTTRQLVENVKGSGIKVGTNVRGHVYNTLHRLSQDDGPFQRLNDGRWSIRQQERADLLRAARH